MNIINDFKRIKRYLGLPRKLSLKIEFNHNEGFYYRNFPMVMIGIKDGYNRRLLVHECLHALGYTHYNPLGFVSVIRFDTYSAKIEKDIFKYWDIYDRYGE